MIYIEIITNGFKRLSIKPDQVTMYLNFYLKKDDYEKVLEEGLAMVYNFFNILINKYNFQKEDLKTSNFTIVKETKYNEETKSFEDDGFSFNQNVELTFDYNLKLLSSLVEELAKYNYPINYSFSFGIKDIEQYRNELLTEAYKDALDKASIIANAAGKKVTDTLKVDNQNNNMVPFEMARLNVSNTISETFERIFTPKDILLEENLSCIFLAN